ncbi:MAG: pyridoxal-dependent decarboxylase [Methylacidiphilales bacterium]|nr:pyridoxal-dependent decarboxylase [Candidatus Methylacidiphilales bacterium]
MDDVQPQNQNGLDPQDWDLALHQFQRAVDAALERQRHIRKQPVWVAPPSLTETPMPAMGMGLKELVDHFEKHILPYATGNTHPKFFGWVHGSGNIYGALGEALAAVMNCNVGGRNHIGTSLEKQVVAWFRNFFGFPHSSAGILTSGTSMGTIIALACARNSRATWDVQRQGLCAGNVSMVAYASAEAHSCVTKALDLLGLGREALRLIPVNAEFRMDTGLLEAAIRADREQKLLPFCVISTIGTVNTGAIDDIGAVAAIAAREGLWHHIDGAFGAFSVCLPRYRHLASVITSADSLAFDMHKWLHVPYDAGCVLIREGEIQRRTFSLRPEYLQSLADGLAGGEPWFCDYGPELSRGFRALKVWFTIQALGFDALSSAIVKNCVQAGQLAEEIARYPQLELLAPVTLNIVCLRVRLEGLSGEPEINTLNRQVIATLQNRGLAVPSTTELSGKVAIRICLTNHRTQFEDLQELIKDILAVAAEHQPTHPLPKQ